MHEFFSSAPRCEQIVQILYGLNELEIQIFCNLMHFGDMDTNELIERHSTLEKKQDKTILNRALNNLLSKDLIFREKSSSAPTPGYRYVYKALTLDELKIKLLGSIDSWYENAKVEIENINERFIELIS